MKTGTANIININGGNFGDKKMITIAKCSKTGEKTNKKRCLKCPDRLILQPTGQMRPFIHGKKATRY